MSRRHGWNFAYLSGDICNPSIAAGRDREFSHENFGGALGEAILFRVPDHVGKGRNGEGLAMKFNTPYLFVIVTKFLSKYSFYYSH